MFSSLYLSSGLGFFLFFALFYISIVVVVVVAVTKGVVPTFLRFAPTSRSSSPGNCSFIHHES